MLTQPARVLSVEQHQVIVESLSKANCPRCAQGVGCGGGVLAKLFGDKSFKLSFDTESLSSEVPEQDQLVQLTVSEKLLVKAALVLYGIPLFSLLAFAIVFSIVFASELIIIFSAVTGFMLGLVAARKISRNLLLKPENKPQLVIEPTVGCYSATN